MKTKPITGCSSFNEASWKGVFYPEAIRRKDWFAFYCQHFNTYEINASFYKFPTPRILANWYDKAPDGFLYSVKMHKGVTHFKKFNDCRQEIEMFYTACRENLKEKLACILFQLPPSFSYSEQRLNTILHSLDYSFKNVIEFRHFSWWRDEVFDAFKEKGIIFCNVSYPNLPEQLVATSTTGYVRLHGVPKLFFSGYEKQRLLDLSNEIQLRDWRETFVYFNNTASENGIVDALTFSQLD